MMEDIGARAPLAVSGGRRPGLIRSSKRLIAVGLIGLIATFGIGSCAGAAARQPVPERTPVAMVPTSSMSPEPDPTATPVGPSPEATSAPFATATPTDPITPTTNSTPESDITDLVKLAPTSTSGVAPAPRPTPKASPGVANPSAAPSRSIAGPVRVKIPNIGVDAAIESVGLDRNDAMATPSSAFTVGWYNRGALPGQPGNAVLDGHLDSAVYGEAVFWRLGELKPGDSIVVQMLTGPALTFVVDHEAAYPYNSAPLDQIFGPSNTPRLNLITCSGVFNRGSHNYDRRLVVYAKLATGHLP